MRIRTFVAGLALLPLAGLTTGFGPGGDCRAVGQNADGPIEVCTVATYLACPGGDEQKAHLNQVHGAVELTEAAPDRSVQTGAGCGHLVQPLVTDGWPVDQDLVVTGTFTGNLDSVAVVLHFLGTGDGQAAAYSEEMNLEVELIVGDETVRSGTITAVPTVSSTGASVSLAFTLEGLGLATETGTGTRSRQVTLRAGYPHTGDCGDAAGGSGCMPEGAYIPVWGTSEVPAGITFN